MLLTFCCMLSHAVCGQTDSITGEAHRLAGVDVVAPYNRNVQAATPRQEIGSERLLTMGIESLTDALKSMAGVTLRDYGGAGGMKTLSVRGIGSRHTQVVYDGFALSNSQTGEIDLSRYSLNFTDRITLTIGDDDQIFLPARSIIGAATLRVESRGARVTPTSPPRGEPLGREPFWSSVDARLSAGSWGTVSPALFYGQQLSENVSVTAMGEYLYAENDYPFTLHNGNFTTRERRVNSRMSSGHGEANMLWHITKATQLQTKVYYYDNSRRLPGIVRLYTQENDERLHERNAFAQARLHTTLSPRWRLQAHAKWDWTDTDYRNNNPGSVATSARYLQREAYTSASALYDATSWLSMSVAADYIYNHLQNAAATLHGPDRHSMLQSAAARIKMQRFSATAKLLAMEVTDKVTRQPAQHTNRLIPSVSASYRLLPAEQLFLRAMWKQGLRMPSFNELYFFHLGASELRPEKANQWNIGVTWQNSHTERWNVALTIDGYVTNVKDKIVAIPFNMFVWRMMNLSKVRTRGLDITADTRYTINNRHSIEMTVGYSLQRSENRNNPTSQHYKKQVAYMPQNTWNIAVGWKNPWINISMTNSGMDERWATNEHYNNTRISGFTETSVSLWRSLRIRTVSCTLRASVLNIFDKQYELVGNYPMPGRSWKITAKIEL